MNPYLSLTLSFFLFAFITNLSPNNAAKQVLDIHGTPLIPGSQYYIFPASEDPSSGGLGLILNKVGNLRCPVTVLKNNDMIGLPVKFTVLGSSTGNILTGTDLEIEFTKKPDCAASSKWLMFHDHDTKLTCVGIGGPTNYPGIETNSGKNLIMKHRSGHVYRLGVYLDFHGHIVYNDIGLSMFNSGEGGSLLALAAFATDAYPVVFVDAASFKYGSPMSVQGWPKGKAT